MVDLRAIFRHRPDLRYRLIDGEAVVVRQEAAEVLALNGVGARVLELLDGRRTVGEVVDRLYGEFEVDRAELERDVARFVAELATIGVTEEVPGGETR